MSRADELRAELAVVELEERLVQAKADGEDHADLKHELREARRVFREGREQSPPDIADGDAVARPDTVEVVTGVLSPGGVE